MPLTSCAEGLCFVSSQAEHRADFNSKAHSKLVLNFAMHLRALSTAGPFAWKGLYGPSPLSGQQMTLHARF